LLSTFDVSYNDLEGEIPTLFDTSVVVDGNQKLGDPSLGHDCASTEALSVVSTLSAERTTGKIVFAISFGAFFFVGVLYDQTVLSRYLGVQTLV
jgi:hypothetical protein